MSYATFAAAFWVLLNVVFVAARASAGGFFGEDA